MCKTHNCTQHDCRKCGEIDADHTTRACPMQRCGVEGCHEVHEKHYCSSCRRPNADHLSKDCTQPRRSKRGGGGAGRGSRRRRGDDSSSVASSQSGGTMGGAGGEAEAVSDWRKSGTAAAAAGRPASSWSAARRAEPGSVQAVTRAFRGELGKLTEDKFERVLGKLQVVAVHSHGALDAAAAELRGRMCGEALFRGMYLRLIARLADKVTPEAWPFLEVAATELQEAAGAALQASLVRQCVEDVAVADSTRYSVVDAEEAEDAASTTLERLERLQRESDRVDRRNKLKDAKLGNLELASCLAGAGVMSASTFRGLVSCAVDAAERALSVSGHDSEADAAVEALCHLVQGDAAAVSGLEDVAGRVARSLARVCPDSFKASMLCGRWRMPTSAASAAGAGSHHAQKKKTKKQRRRERHKQQRVGGVASAQAPAPSVAAPVAHVESHLKFAAEAALTALNEAAGGHGAAHLTPARSTTPARSEAPSVGRWRHAPQKARMPEVGGGSWRMAGSKPRATPPKAPRAPTARRLGAPRTLGGAPVKLGSRGPPALGPRKAAAAPVAPKDDAASDASSVISGVSEASTASVAKRTAASDAAVARELIKMDDGPRDDGAVKQLFGTATSAAGVVAGMLASVVDGPRRRRAVVADVIATLGAGGQMRASDVVDGLAVMLEQDWADPDDPADSGWSSVLMDFPALPGLLGELVCKASGSAIGREEAAALLRSIPGISEKHVAAGADVAAQART
mmetsp:Transcript_180587/g.439453  ORF Transcript_180587/g.439453 Transcript_180587/m.439453 type:complete len:742 (-) Transcript_180587:39-2264(-)